MEAARVARFYLALQLLGPLEERVLWPSQRAQNGSTKEWSLNYLGIHNMT